MTTPSLRLAFAALAIALAVPGALLVQRALASVALEREARERAVAERAFDEMERALSELLREEEARPASDYDFASEASPLREKPEGALALGWFQIEADGRVATPSWAEQVAALGKEVAEEGARFELTKPGAPAASATVPLRAKAKRTEAPNVARVAPQAGRSPAPPTEAPAIPATPTSESVRAAADDLDRSMDPSFPIPAIDQASQRKDAGSAQSDAYDALAKLNTGAKEREQRKQRVYVEEQAIASEPSQIAQTPPSVPPSLGRAAAGAPAASTAATDSRERSEALVAEALAAPPALSEWSELKDERDSAIEVASGNGEAKADLATQDAPAQQPARAELAARVSSREDAQPGSELVRVVVDPMRGRLAKSGELLLVRSAWIGTRGVRQGVALDVASLERVLAGAAQGLGALPSASIRLVPTAQLANSASTPERRTFTHRFAEPFDALGAELAFAPFADDGARSVSWLAALFALAGVGGLFAVYRMTAVALHFAERRSNFAAAVSHELKTPLTAIRLYAEMLRDGLVSGDEKRREYYGSITAETERLSRLINNVLEFSRLEKGVRSVALQVGDVGPVVREAAELLRAHAAEHGLTLELSVDPALPPVRFERDALLQVVFNLVDNAVKYGRGEPAKIEIACRRAGAGVAIVVRDHGPGVPREEHARILEPFYRRGDELTRSAPGAGIGLALVRSLAQQMGAELGVANAEGGGLAVSLELPPA